MHFHSPSPPFSVLPPYVRVDFGSTLETPDADSFIHVKLLDGLGREIVLLGMAPIFVDLAVHK